MIVPSNIVKATIMPKKKKKKQQDRKKETHTINLKSMKKGVVYKGNKREERIAKGILHDIQPIVGVPRKQTHSFVLDQAPVKTEKQKPDAMKKQSLRLGPALTEKNAKATMEQTKHVRKVSEDAARRRQKWDARTNDVIDFRNIKDQVTRRLGGVPTANTVHGIQDFRDGKVRLDQLAPRIQRIVRRQFPELIEHNVKLRRENMKYKPSADTLARAEKELRASDNQGKTRQSRPVRGGPSPLDKRKEQFSKDLAKVNVAGLTEAEQRRMRSLLGHGISVKIIQQKTDEIRSRRGITAAEPQTDPVASQVSPVRQGMRSGGMGNPFKGATQTFGNMGNKVLSAAQKIPMPNTKNPVAQQAPSAGSSATPHRNLFADPPGKPLWKRPFQNTQPKPWLDLNNYFMQDLLEDKRYPTPISDPIYNATGGQRFRTKEDAEREKQAKQGSKQNQSR